MGCCVSQLICAHCFAATRRRAHPDHHAVPPTPAIDSHWLTGALRRCGLLGPHGTVTALHVDEIVVTLASGADVHNGGGLAGARTVRVRDISYGGVPTPKADGGGGGGGGGGPPTSLIEKWATDTDVVGGSTAHPDSVAERVFMGVLLGMRGDRFLVNEVTFYSERAAALGAATGLRLPVVYYTGLDGAAGVGSCLYAWRRAATYVRGVILMEDLALSGYRGCGHVILDWEQAPAPGLAESAMRALGRLHGWGWGPPGRQEEARWTSMMTGAAWLTHTFATKQWGTNTKLQQLLDIWGDHPQRAILRRSEVLDMLWDFRAGVGRWVDRAKALPRRQTTLHGDFHRGNLFTRAARGASPSAEDVAIVDWAMTGAGHAAWEIVYFFVTTMDPSAHSHASTGTPERLLAEQMRLIECYHQDFTRQNPEAAKGYSAQQLKADVKLVWAQQLVSWLDDVATAEQLALDTLARRGAHAHSTDPAAIFGGLAAQLSGDHSLAVALERWLLFHRQGPDHWGDYFDGTRAPPARAAQEEAAAKRALQREHQKELAKKTAELDARTKPTPASTEQHPQGGASGQEEAAPLVSSSSHPLHAADKKYA